jgi:hypothetical protein
MIFGKILIILEKERVRKEINPLYWVQWWSLGEEIRFVFLVNYLKEVVWETNKKQMGFWDTISKRLGHSYSSCVSKKRQLNGKYRRRVQYLNSMLRVPKEEKLVN